MLAGRPRPGRGVDVPMKLLFGAGQQPLDVAPVAPDHKGCYRRRQDGIQPVMAQQEKHGYRHAGRGGHGAQGHIAGQQPQAHEQAPGDQSHPPVQQQHQHAAGEDALAAPQAEEHREHVPQLAANACNQQAQGPVAHYPVHQIPADEAGQHGFPHVADDDAQGIPGAVGPVEVRQARVAAAVLADIVPDDEMGGHHRPVEAAQQIRHQQRQGHGKYHRHVSYPPRPSGARS